MVRPRISERGSSSQSASALVDEAVALLAVDERDHHRQHVGEREQPAGRAHRRERQVERQLGRGASARRARGFALPLPGVRAPSAMRLEISAFLES